MKKNFRNFLMGSAMFELANDPGTAKLFNTGRKSR